MFASFAVFFLCICIKECFSSKLCPPLNVPIRGTVACFSKNETVNCSSEHLEGTVARFMCPEFYTPSTEVSVCLPNGNWSLSMSKCVLDCGRRSGFISLVRNGAMAVRGSFPWHTAIFNLVNGVHEYWCGGSLISETIVITAAHCVWKATPGKLTLAFGKFQREYNAIEDHVQKIKAKRIEILDSYQDVDGNYNGDVAIVFLEKPVAIGPFAAPVCLDLEVRLMDKQLREGSSGVVLGWGLTENDTFSDQLKVVSLPVISNEKCIAEQEQDFKKFITYTSFCAGFSNGTGVCNGDSGGGLTFFDESSARWYLQGIVSVSPRRKGTPYCDTRFFTVFTKVGMFSKWLKKSIKFGFAINGSSNEISSSKGKGKDLYSFVREYFGQNGQQFFGKKYKFPHTDSMLKLVSQKQKENL